MIGAMIERKILLLLASGFPLLAACTGGERTVEACENPKLLRVQVGDTIFELPNTVDRPHALTMDLERESAKLGIVSIGNTARHSDSANRGDCNSKEHPIANFGYDMGFRYLGDGSEPPEYRMGDEMYAGVNVTSYDPASPSRARSEYLTDVERISQVRFVGRTDHPRRGHARIKEATFEFADGERTFRLECQIGWYASSEPGEESLRPSKPRLCVPDATFRAGNVLISADQQSEVWGQKRPIPPEEWPKQWAYTINKVLSFRVQGKPN